LNQEEIKKEEELIKEKVNEEIEELKEDVVEEVKKEEEKIEEEVKKVEEEVKEEVAVGYKKADVVKRIVAYLIDAILAFVLSLILTPFGALVSCAYILLRDGFDFMQNRSIGKMAVNLKPIVVETGANCDLQTSIKRNWPLAIGHFLAGLFLPLILILIIPLLIYVVIEAVLVFTDDKGLRLGDKMAGTQVIEL